VVRKRSLSCRGAVYQVSCALLCVPLLYMHLLLSITRYLQYHQNEFHTARHNNLCGYFGRSNSRCRVHYKALYAHRSTFIIVSRVTLVRFKKNRTVKMYAPMRLGLANTPIGRRNNAIVRGLFLQPASQPSRNSMLVVAAMAAKQARQSMEWPRETKQSKPAKQGIIIILYYYNNYTEQNRNLSLSLK